MMAHIYADTGRYNEALTAVRTATRLEPNSEISRQGQDMAAALFAQLFLSPKGEELPPIEALGMFFEFRELTPIGRRGDEMIRRLADRLVLDRPARPGGRTVAVPGRQAARRRRARAGRSPPRHGVPDPPQARPRHRRASLDPHRRSLRRTAAAAAAAGSARAERCRPARSRARHHLEPVRARGGPAAFGYLLGLAQMARVGRADRIVLCRPLARLQTAQPGGEGRRDPRRGRLCARRRRDRAGAVPREICAADERRGRPLCLRDRERAWSCDQRRIRADRKNGGRRRYARRVPARDEAAFPRRHRARAAAAGNW